MSVSATIELQKPKDAAVRADGQAIRDPRLFRGLVVVLLALGAILASIVGAERSRPQRRSNASRADSVRRIECV